MSVELTVVLEDHTLSLTRPANDLTVAAVGAQGPVGPQGPAGSAGGSVFEHVQSSAQATWTINHDRGRKVHVSVFDDAGNVVIADVQHGSINQATVVFAVPTTGSAVIS